MNKRRKRRGAMRQTPEGLEPIAGVIGKPVEVTDQGPDSIEIARQNEEAIQKREQQIQLFGAGLERKFQTDVGLKEEIERRWIDDYRHYNGVYDQETTSKLLAENGGEARKGAIVFVNLTRAKCNLAESKWSDLVLPTDDRNWGISPTPVPTLVKDLENEAPLTMPDGTTAVDPDTDEAYKVKDLAEETMRQAKKSAEDMEREIDDQLKQTRFDALTRDVIHDAVVIGSGIAKGPMVERSSKSAWIQSEAGEWELVRNEDHAPTAHRVDPWNFFPDMSSPKWEDCEHTFERHLMTKKQLRRLAKHPGFFPSQIAKVLMTAPNASQAKLNYLTELRSMTGVSLTSMANRYQVVEYYGPIEKADLEAFGYPVNMDDPLEEYEGVVWFCNGIVIKVGINHMDSEDLPYNVLCWEKDDACVFGSGVARRMKDSQKVMNASWRMVLDNAGLSTGPQILINKKLVEPADGSWELTPRKIWWILSKDPNIRADYLMQTFNIDSHQTELASIFEMARRISDEETSLPQLASNGISGDTNQPAMLKTLGGTALWMSSNNIMMRRAVKNFDDDFLTPFITRFYDWNMQFSKREEIKGDFNVDARGTSVLLVREMQARNIESFVATAINLPGGAAELETRGVMKAMAKGMQLPASSIMRTDAEHDAAVEEAKTNPPKDPETLKLEMQMNLKQMEIDDNRAEREANMKKAMIEAEGMHQVELMRREVALTKLAVDGKVNLEKVRQDHDIKKYQTDWNMRQFYEELDLKKTVGTEANYGLESDMSAA